ncbi:MAG: hypothetical protein LIP00_01900 [Parabacteroides sp.]|nr:hypothetical protein [Parabacteroides sp.]
MKKISLIFVSALLSCTVKAQTDRHFIFTTTVGTAIPLDRPASTPFTWQFAAHYPFSRRFSAGAGTGLSFYEKTVIPLFAGMRFDLLKPRKFTPYAVAGIGYGFTLSGEANGGLYLHPAIGVRYACLKKLQFLLSAGYELQKLERRKTHGNRFFSAEWKEQLSHHSLTIKAGLVF